METRTLRNEGLRCPFCLFDKVSASDNWCWRCARILPEDWVAQQA